MINEKLINNMMNCNGMQMNCAKCMFREHPDCRNAMARHAGALIQLQEVVIENNSPIVKKVAVERAEWQKKYNGAMDTLKLVTNSFNQLVEGLAVDRHCSSCYANHAQLSEAEKEEVCKRCREEGSEWILWEGYGKPPEEPEDVVEEIDEEAGYDE